MQRADRGKPAVRAFDGEHRDPACLLVHHGQMDRSTRVRGIAPQAEQREAAGPELIGGETPGVLPHHDARPRAMVRDRRAYDHVDRRRHPYPTSFATFWNQATSAGGM